MSDNITREPYRNAWYKQLQDAIEEAEPRLVPEYNAEDSGKILSVNEEGKQVWTQPPEELPLIQESDEGKVLKVDDGVPKWLTDSDSEWLVVNAVRSGSSPNYTYTVNKTYDEIKPFADKGKAVLVYGNNNWVFYLELSSTPGNQIKFVRSVSYVGGALTDGYKYCVSIRDRYFTIDNNNVVTYTDEMQYVNITPTPITDGSTMTEVNYNFIKVSHIGICTYNGKYLYLSNVNSANTEFDFINENEGIKAHIDANRLVTITEIPKYPLPMTPINHNGIFRGIDLTTKYTIQQLHEKISTGDFDDLYIGDYIPVNLTTDIYYFERVSSSFDPDKTYYERSGTYPYWTYTVTSDVTPDVSKVYYTKEVVSEPMILLIAHFDYYRTSDEGTATALPHHVVLTPLNYPKKGSVFNMTASTVGGYLNSYVHQNHLPCYLRSLESAIPYLIAWKDYLSSEINENAASPVNPTWVGVSSKATSVDIKIRLLSEIMITGASSVASSFRDTTGVNGQLAYFKFKRHSAKVTEGGNGTGLLSEISSGSMIGSIPDRTGIGTTYANYNDIKGSIPFMVVFS